MTKKEEFLTYIQERKERYEWQEIESGLMVKDNQLNTTTLLTPEAFEKHTLAQLILTTHQGKNVEHITRVTGYMSKVSGWNKGKRQELIDRSRTTRDLQHMTKPEETTQIK